MHQEAVTGLYVHGLLSLFVLVLVILAAGWTVILQPHDWSTCNIIGTIDIHYRPTYASRMVLHFTEQRCSLIMTRT